MKDKVQILLVDDEKRIREVYAYLLDDLGYHVETAANPDEAMALAAVCEFDIAFIDQHLGPAKGTDLMQALKSTFPGLSIVIITADPHTDLAVDAMKKGALDFISKPFSIGDLQRSIVMLKKETI